MTEQNSTQNWKTKYLIGGVVFGALAGLITSYFLIRNAEETHGGPPEIRSIDILRSGIGVAGIIRAIAALGD